MLTIDADPKEVREITRKVLSLLNKNEFVGLIWLILGDHDVQTSNIWYKVEPMFFRDPVYEFPVPHPDAFVEMGRIANERKENENQKHAPS